MTFKHADKFPPAPRVVWRDVEDKYWNDWHWQQQNRLKTVADFERVINLSDAEKQAFSDCSEKFKVAVTPYYASLISPEENCPIRLQAIPSPLELSARNTFESVDPLGEEAQSPVSGIVHRYPDRVLLYTNHNCPVYCRFCTRKRKVGNPFSMPDRDEEDNAIAYIAEHEQIRDVIISGGHPLSLSNKRLDQLLEKIYAIPHVEIIRIGTRNLVTLPQRIDNELVGILSRFRPIFVMTHFNHPKECTREAYAACRKLTTDGISIFNQSVILKGVNDSAKTIKELNQKLLLMQVKPYYLYQCDQILGAAHFRTSLEECVEILRGLQGWTSGLAVPHLVIDLPDGGGKVCLEPNSLGNETSNFIFRNYLGERFHCE
ncbi:MAG: KamA family radical SAM protein [Acidobacteria bacterium]|nr:KamA family radical SAM protein [Acidobacteriota bacterium]